MKRCWACKQEKPITEYSRNRSKSSGYSAECKACVRQYNLRHLASKTDYYKTYRKERRVKDLAWYLYLECRARAKRNGQEFDLLPEDIVIPACCPVFGFKFRVGRQFRDFSASVDRKDSSRGYVRGNIQVISYLANRMKSNADLEQLKRFAQWILESSNDSQRSLDTRQGAPENTYRCDRETLGGSHTWQSGNDQHASERSAGPIAEDFARLLCH